MEIFRILSTLIGGFVIIAEEVSLNCRWVDIIGASAGNIVKFIFIYFLGFLGGLFLLPEYKTGEIANNKKNKLFTPSLFYFLSLIGILIISCFLFYFPYFSYRIFLPVIVSVVLIGGICSGVIFEFLILQWGDNAFWGYIFLAGGGIIFSTLFLSFVFKSIRDILLWLVILVFFLLFSSQKNPYICEDSNDKTEGLSTFTSYFYLIVFFSGFVIMAIETLVLYQLIQIFSDNSFSGILTFDMVYMSLLLSGITVAGLRKFFKNCNIIKTICWFLIPYTFLVLTEPFIFTIISNFFNNPYMKFWTKVLIIWIGIFLPLFIFIGIIFPFLLLRVPNIFTKKLIIFNNLGSVAGIIFCYKVLLRYAGIWKSFFVIGIISFVIVVILTEVSSSQKTKLRLGYVLIILVLVYLFLKDPYRYIVITSERGYKTVESITDVEGIVKVVKKQDCFGIIVNNSYLIASERGKRLLKLRAILSLDALGNNTQKINVCLIGMGTGMMANFLLEDTRVSRLESIEISNSVVKLAKKYFSSIAPKTFRDKRNKIIIADGRTYLHKTSRLYNLVIEDVFLPWRNGISRFYTIEHYKDIYSHLINNGCFIQWIPLYQITLPQLKIIFNTFKTIFKNNVVLINYFGFISPIVGIVGYKNDFPFFMKVEDKSFLNKYFYMFVVGDIDSFLKSLPSSKYAINTLVNNRLEFDIFYSFFYWQKTCRDMVWYELFYKAFSLGSNKFPSIFLPYRKLAFRWLELQKNLYLNKIGKKLYFKKVKYLVYQSEKITGLRGRELIEKIIMDVRPRFK